jgi:hypothetical protein
VPGLTFHLQQGSEDKERDEALKRLEEAYREQEQEQVQRGEGNQTFVEPRTQLPLMGRPLKEPDLPPLVQCAWAGDDCSKVACCNDVRCDLKFQSCAGFQCFKKDEYWSSCAASADELPADWNGTVVGGSRQTREILPAPADVKVQGTKLFCFAAVAWFLPAQHPWWSAESQRADNLIVHNVSIFQCDAHALFPITNESQTSFWSGFANIETFVDVWKRVKEDGQWLQHDWTVKVDVDSVFFPDRLRQHLLRLRTPKGARVYIKNIDYQFEFFGAIEVLTKEALQLYFHKGDECIEKHEHPAGGEDYFMRLCMDGIGIDHQTDFTLLQDKITSRSLHSRVDCTDNRTVVFHPFKDISRWNECYNEAVCGEKSGFSCASGINVWANTKEIDAA